ncbi:MAG: PucR family transcriptional regulator ligand-binding domain-containing protein, partial [Lachnospiraceae bacterium]|nr:PucR family transcriptional regulator ligand-binding domain-containing protein [Lachnospiraceae bacterium]
MIFVRDLLKLDSFKKMELKTGSAGLSRKVSWPNIAQTVSIREWLVGGDVILLSGVGLDITDEL